jgi:type I restriction enzyme R subunit
VNPASTQGELFAAIAPVADRLLKTYKAAQSALNDAEAKGQSAAAQAARNQLDALLLFRRNLGNFLRVYAFLSQIHDYGATALEKRAIFYKRLLPLLEFGREREGIDLSDVVLTHYKLKGGDTRKLSVTGRKALEPLREAGGEVQDKQKALLAEILQKVNDLFEGELTDDDKLVYVYDVIRTKMLESEILVQQAAANTKEQFANSPDFLPVMTDAIMDSFAAHTTMSRQALESQSVREGLKDILLGPAQLYEALRERGRAAKATPAPDA